ncbi:MAG: hypothetical protein ACI8RP_001640 [Urechidicola sp.]|jgi:succinylglutamate desuccinylase
MLNELNAIKNKEYLNQEEQEELMYEIKQLLASTKSAICFIDLYTMFIKSLPFITINDALINRKFSSCFSVPIVLGIEEYLEVPLLAHLNTLGYVSIGFEPG